MKKIMTLLVVVVAILGLSGLASATGGGHFQRSGVHVDIVTTAHPIMNAVDAEFTHDGESKTATGTPNPNGPAGDAWNVGPVTMSDGTKFKIQNGNVWKKSPGDSGWKRMWEKKSKSSDRI